MINIKPTKLIAINQLTANVKEFILELREPSFSFIPGQFLTVHFQQETKNYKRSYSLSKAPNTLSQDTLQIEFAASYVDQGVGSEYLFSLKPGDEIMISGPYGRLILNEYADRYCLIATGTGVTPYRAMLPILAAKLKQHSLMQVVILVGTRTRQDLIYHADFLDFVKAFPFQVIYKVCLSREESFLSAEDNECDGHVQAQFPNLNLAPGKDLVYLCGNPQMIDESYQYLLGAGFDSKQIIREKYISNRS